MSFTLTPYKVCLMLLTKEFVLDEQQLLQHDEKRQLGEFLAQEILSQVGMAVFFFLQNFATVDALLCLYCAG